MQATDPMEHVLVSVFAVSDNRTSERFHPENYAENL